MKSSNKDNIEGKILQVKGAVKEVVGKAIGNRNMEIDGKVESIDGKIQQKLSQVEKVIEK
ncbi:MAG: CsbD family protein [Desulfobulbaceae bacterium]|nr:MAG: CsbD family protein [Desulfobulbaceae bacterium]